LISVISTCATEAWYDVL